MDEAQIGARLAELEGWESQGQAIARSFELGSFKGSVDFVNRITPVAEEMNHHPDLKISWGTVRVRLTTHSKGGLTEADFELARRIDALV